MSYYSKYLLLVLHNMCSSLKYSEAVIILYKGIDERPHYRMIWVPLLKMKKNPCNLYPQIINNVKDHKISCTAPAKEMVQYFAFDCMADLISSQSEVVLSGDMPCC